MVKKLAILISNKGTGTNLQAIIDSINDKSLNARIVCVISDTSESKGLERAKKHSIETENVLKKEDLLRALKKYSPELICLAGWKQIILGKVIDSFPNKILNLHPGLVPDNIDAKVLNPDGTKGEWNKGGLTDKAIHNILDTKNTYAGSSIHFLTHEFDFGPVLGRCFEKVKKGDSVETLYRRLKIKENKLYRDVLIGLCNMKYEK
jgi:phosphoribosylglycinamide formyltransferase 1